VRYAKVSRVIWNDERFRAFTDDGKLAFLATLTHQDMTVLGAMRATYSGLAAELGWPAARFRRALAPAVQAGMVEVDEPACFVGFRNFLKHNDVEGPNVVNGAWLPALERIPECPAKTRLIAHASVYLEKKAETWKGGRAAVKPAVWAAFSSGASLPTPGGGTIPPSMPPPSQGTIPPTIPPSMPGSKSDSVAVAVAVAGTVAGDPPVAPQGGDVLKAQAGFDRFWAAYPKKVGKDAALRKWRERRCEAIADEVLAALERQRGYLMREEGKYIPNPCTWLNQGRWKDDPPALKTDRRRVNDAWAGKTEAGIVRL